MAIFTIKYEWWILLNNLHQWETWLETKKVLNQKNKYRWNFSQQCSGDGNVVENVFSVFKMISSLVIHYNPCWYYFFINSFNCFPKWLFIYRRGWGTRRGRGTVRKIIRNTWEFHLLVHFQNACQSQMWGRLSRFSTWFASSKLLKSLSLPRVFVGGRSESGAGAWVQTHTSMYLYSLRGPER